MAVTVRSNQLTRLADTYLQAIQNQSANNNNRFWQTLLDYSAFHAFLATTRDNLTRASNAKAFKHLLQELAKEVERFGEANAISLNAETPNDLIPTKESLCDELRAIRTRYRRCTLNEHELSLSFREPVVLQEVNLGHFRITIDLDRYALGDLQVEAEAPVYPPGDEDHPHPHVENGSLCMGEGESPYCKAINQGRLLDAVVIVERLLHTYGDSPYVPIEAWDGEECIDCNEIFSEEEIRQCVECKNKICEECTGCNDDGTMYCNNCVKECVICSKSKAEKSLQECSGCKDKVCKACSILNADKNTICNDCEPDLTCDECEIIVSSDEELDEDKHCEVCVKRINRHV